MFSVLMSVYHCENPAYFQEALASLVSQVSYFEEVVLVKDGPIGDALSCVIDDASRMLPMKVVSLAQNVGLAHALNVGLQNCSSEWVFRFDADDVCEPGRASIQASALQDDGLDIVGGQIQECEPDTLAPIGIRRVPCEAADIERFLKRRNPFNHMAVCFRKSLVCAPGGSPQLCLKEDYGLWVKSFASGARVMNVPDIVVRARAGSA
jgi:glycosyltransferase involved in cell wall biosynthesis